MLRVLQDFKGNDVDRRRVGDIMLTRIDETSFLYNPSDLEDYQVIVPGENTSLKDLKRVAEERGLNLYFRFKGSEHFTRGQIAELLGDEGDQ